MFICKICGDCKPRQAHLENWVKCIKSGSYYCTNSKKVRYSELSLSTKKIKSRHLYLKEQLNYLNPRKVLEIGGGECFSTRDLSKENKIELDNIDLYVDIKLMIEFNISGQIRFKAYDLLILDNIIEHIIDLKSFLDKYLSLVDQNGYVYISTPNIRNIKNFLKFNLNNEFNHLPEHVNVFSRNSIITIMESYKFQPYRPKLIVKLKYFPQEISAHYYSLFGNYLFFRKLNK